MTDGLVSKHVDSLCSLPEAMHSPAIIQNPCNENETLIIGAAKMCNIYIYNHTTDVFTKNKNDDLNTILLKGERNGLEIAKVYAINALKPGLIIVFGTTCYNRDVRNFPFYSLFDSKSLSFEKIGSKLFNNDKIDTSKQLKNQKAIYNIDNNTYKYHLTSTNQDALDAAKYLPFWSGQSRFNTYKNYLLFTNQNILGVYDISDEYNPILLMHVNLGDEIKISFHGAVILPCHMSDDNGNNNKNIVKLLVFGGYGHKTTFLTSFLEYEINFDEIESQFKEKNIEIITGAIDDKILSNIVKQTKNDILSKSLNFQGLKDAAEKVKFELNAKYGIFEYTSNLYNSRYLMIYGLFKPSIGGVNMMINFDFQRKKWTIVNDIWPIDAGFCFKGHAIIRSKCKRNWLQTTGGIILLQGARVKSHATKNHFGFKLHVNIDWSIERLLWLAYLKNNNSSCNSNNDDNNNNANQLQYCSCGLSTLPKDIILLILKFLRNGFVFDT